MPNSFPPSSDGLSRLTEIMRQESAPPPEPPRPPVDPGIRRRRRRLTALVAGLVAVVVAGSAGGYAAWALGAPVGAATIVTEAPEVELPEAAQLILSPDSVMAVSVSGGEGYLPADASGIWAMGGGDGPRPIASITKLITALTILDAKPLASADDPGPTITFSRADNALYDKYYVLGATIAAMPTGSSLSLHDALEAMLVVSACNYAEAVSTWAFGSQSAFLRAARDWLARNGLTSTTIVEPTGIDPRNTSTPADLIALGKLALANPAVAQIVGMSSLQVPGIPVMLATNTLLSDDGVTAITGLKTGTLEGSGSNLLFSATLDVGLEQRLGVVGVVLGGFTRDSVNLDVQALLRSIREGFHEVQLGEAGQRVGRYVTPWGESAEIRLGVATSLLTWSDTSVTSTLEVDTLTTGSEGDVVGILTWTAGTESIRVPLQLGGDIDPPDAWWRLTHPDQLG